MKIDSTSMRKEKLHSRDESARKEVMGVVTSRVSETPIARVPRRAMSVGVGFRMEK